MPRHGRLSFLNVPVVQRDTYLGERLVPDVCFEH